MGPFAAAAHHRAPINEQERAMDTKDSSTPSTDKNRDPITGAPGSHPVGTGVGAVAGGVATGAAVGTIAGPVGTAIGAAVGAVVGGLAGKAVAESIDPSAEDAYWREHYSDRPYVKDDASYDDYAPAFGMGWTAYERFPDRPFDTVESDLGRDWNERRANSNLEWEEAKHAARDAWERVSDRVERAVPGDSDRDGR
jgi:hypothetical protein